MDKTPVVSPDRAFDHACRNAGPLGSDFATGDSNPYAYAGNDPINSFDPLGLYYAELYAGYGGAFGASIAAAGSVEVDIGTGGLNLVATPQEIAAGSATGATIGYTIGNAFDYIFHASRGKNFLEPDPAAQGPHCGFRRSPNLKIENYEEYDKNGRTVKRFRGTGKEHDGVKPPLVLDPAKPNSRPKVPRPAEPGEIPGGGGSNP